MKTEEEIKRRISEFKDVMSRFESDNPSQRDIKIIAELECGLNELKWVLEDEEVKK